MKIGYFCTAFPYKNAPKDDISSPYEIGGVELVSYNLALQMVKRGHDVHVYTSSRSRNDCLEQNGGITVHRYGHLFKIGEAPMSHGLLYKPLIQGNDLDIVHVHLGNLPAPLAGCWYADTQKKPLIISYHGEAIGGFGQIRRRLGVFLYNHCLRDRILARATTIVALSQRQVESSAPLQKFTNKVEIIPNGVQISDFTLPLSRIECRKILGLPRDRQIILFVEALNPIKSPDTLVHAMQIVLRDRPEAYLVLVGDGPLREYLQRCVHALNLEDAVSLVGFDAENKSLYFNAADIFVLPSVAEAFGIVLLEAMASHIPIVASRVGGVPSLIREGENGLLIAPKDVHGLAAAICRLLEDESLRCRMGENGFRSVQDYSWERIAKDTEALYSRSISRGVIS